jgi:hypothetical protein
MKNALSANKSLARLLSALLTLVSCSLSAQREADCFVIGYCDYFLFHGCNIPYGSSIYKFNEAGIEEIIEPAGLNLSTDYSRAAFSDKHTGDLLFASNGWRLVNRSGQVLAHKLWRNDIPHPQDTPDTTGVLNSLGPLFLNDPGDDTKAYLFYGQYRRGTFPGIGPAKVDVLFTYAYLDIPTQSLISKGNVILTDTTAPGDMSACRHANGRDWWLFKSGRNENEVYVGLLNPQGIQMQKRILPGVYDSLQISTFSYFNQNGDKYIHYSGSNRRRVYAFDFDRCSGELSNMVVHDLKDSIRSGDWTASTISGDGSKFYFRRSSLPLGVAGTGGIFQLDLNTGEVHKIISTISTAQQLTPNYKEILLGDRIIYSIELDSVIQTLSKIKNPNLAGSQCEVVRHTDTVLNVPNFISPSTFANFRLGKLVGSPCDTIVSSINDELKVKSVKLFPNPTQDLLNIELSGELDQHVHFAIYSMQGQLIENGFFKGIKYTIDLHSKQINAGLYIIRLIVENQMNYTKKFVYEKP